MRNRAVEFGNRLLLQIRWLILHAQMVFTIAVIMLLLLGYARLYSQNQELKQQWLAACELRVAGRASTNKELRIPLKAALDYLGDLGDQGARQAKDPVALAASLAFAARFHGYADQVKKLPNPKC